jgi:hypothetical protein
MKVSDSQIFEDDLLDRVREVAPLVPADVLSSTGPSAQRVLTHVLATAERKNAAGPTLEPVNRPTEWTARWSTWLTRRRAHALAGLVAVIAIVVSVLVIGGSGPSIVSRAYAATDPAGVIVHYVETTHSSLQAKSRVPDRDEFWTYGQDSHEILDANDPQGRQDIVTSNGELQTLAFGTLSITPSWPAKTNCAAALVLEGGCAQGQDNSPVDALRSLYRSGQLHATGHTTVNGRRLDVLTGSSNNLHVRALIDARTFLPVKVTMSETLGQLPGARPVTDALTITGYQRLPVTPLNRQLLALPAHPHVPVIRFHSCPTKTNPRNLCRSIGSVAHQSG